LLLKENRTMITRRPDAVAPPALGTVQGRVTRINDDGFAVEFTRRQHADFLEQDITTA
jgi:hypothetical protein